MNRDMKIYIALAIIVIAIIAVIYYIKPSPGTPEEKAMKCIAGKVVLYTQTGCGHCETQKEILGDYYNLFTDINCLTERDKCSEAGITGTPTWIINGTKYSGTKSIEQLKQLTGC